MKRTVRNKWVVIIDQLLVANAVVFVLGLLTGAIDWATGAVLLLAMSTLHAISKYEKSKTRDGGD